MSKNYNVVLNSNYCTFDTVGNAVYNKNYYIDWSAILPDKKFKLTFSFVSEVNYVDLLTEIPIISIDFLNMANIIRSNQSSISYQAISSNILGLVFPTNIDTNAHHAYFRADKSFNPPIYLSRPNQNNFNVKINDNNNPTGYWLDDNTIPGSMSNYVLILSFEECD